MTVVQYLVGVAATTAYLAGACLAARAVRRRWLPALDPALTAVAGAVVLVAAIVAPALVVGSLGWFGRTGLIVAVGAIAAASLRAAANPGRPPAVRPGDPDPGQNALGRLGPVAVLGAAALVVIRWSAEVLQAASRGYRQPDDLHYHLTHAAHMVQSGSTWPVRFDSVGDAAAFHPGNAELIHGIALALFGRDLLSLVVNVPFVALALVAGWSIGREAGNAAAGAVITSAALALRGFTPGGGSALNDVVALALLLAAVALLLEARRHEHPAPLVTTAGLAAGLAVGTKLTVLVPVVGLVVLASVAGGRANLGLGGRYVGAALIGGGYWYARNLLHVGNPIPALSPGPLPGPELALQRQIEFPLTDYLFDGAVWRSHLAPGLEQVFGPVWPLLVVVGVVAPVALVVAAWRGRTPAPWPITVIVGVASLGAYAITPTSAAGREGDPSFFVLNLRYAVPGLLLVLLAALALPSLRNRPRAALVAAVVLALSVNAYSLVPVHTLAALGLLGAVGAVAVLLRRRQAGIGPWLALPALAGLAIGFVGQRAALDRRWEDDQPRWELYRAAQEVHGTRMAVTGYPQTYPFFGVDLSNHVTMLGDRSTGDELLPLDGCHAFWDAVAAARAEVVVVVADRSLAGTPLGRAIVDWPRQWLEESTATVLLDDAAGSMALDVRDAAPAC